MSNRAHFNIVGAGLSGALLAILLAQRGYSVDVYERRSDPRRTDLGGGRSINLALAARGIAALEAAGVMAQIRPLMIPMRGRMLHEPAEPPELLPYGSREHEVIWSVSRAALNEALVQAAATWPQVALHFDTGCDGVDPKANTLLLRNAATAASFSVPLTATVATDGAGSVVRNSLEKQGFLEVREDLLDHDYKELSVPAVRGQAALEMHALHIWPRGGFMLIALPNPDSSFTATLFLAKRGVQSFEALRDAASIEKFFLEEFPGTAALMPQQVREFMANPQGILGTVSCSRWHIGGQVLLLGDAAHAIVPFHGQGANCAFEDCLALAQRLDSESKNPQSLVHVFADFEAQRRPNAVAIARMALENYTEMRDTVRDERFQRLKTLSLELERRHPQRFIPRYSMVMFHAEIPYAEALRRGELQAAILDEIERAAAGGAADLQLADRLIAARLSAPPG